ncbi:hypothetical protein OS493_038230 [Desmophyllum pertusum]|uniref:SH3 domain-containing protein n=1 Tax=Desmophyllum pertusum TaxID=174260 RepID=A0A9W9ZVP9_9CNID|nr:hypothetical protein OS493_038230 [Desmophyllum pertusum]
MTGLKDHSMAGQGCFPKSYVRSSERPCARAVYPFVGESLGELTFREGDCIFLRKRLNSQWMEGEINGNVGLFPSSFVAVEVELPPEENSFVNGDFSFMDPSPKDGGGQNNAIASKIQWKRAYLEPVYDIRKHFENKPLKRRTQGFSSDRSFSGIFGDVVSDTGYTNAPQIGGSGQRTSEFVNSYVNRDDDTSIYKSLLDSSFTMDLTPSLLPSNTPATAQETVQRTKPLLKPKASTRN